MKQEIKTGVRAMCPSPRMLQMLIRSLKMALLLVIFLPNGVHAQTYQWYCNGQPAVGQTAKDLTRTENVAGVYSYYCVTTLGDKQLIGPTLVVTVKNVSPLPAITFVMPGTSCGPGRAIFRATATEGSVVEWISENGGVLGIGPTQLLPIAERTYYYVRAHNMATGAVSDESEVVGIMKDATFEAGAIADGAEVICPGGTSQMITSVTAASSGTTYQWYVDENPIAGATSETYTPPTVASVVYRRQVKDATCSAFSKGTWSVSAATVCGDLTSVSDGVNSYKVKTIGCNCWMTQNLNDASKGGMDNPSYGRLYTFGEAQMACPPGWRLPSSAEYQTFITEYGSTANAGKAMKSTTGWNNNTDGTSGNGTNASGFNMFPGGMGQERAGDIVFQGNQAHFWSSEVEWFLSRNNQFYASNYRNFDALCAVRCVKK